MENGGGGVEEDATPQPAMKILSFTHVEYPEGDKVRHPGIPSEKKSPEER